MQILLQATVLIQYQHIRQHLDVCQLSWRTPIDVKIKFPKVRFFINNVV